MKQIFTARFLKAHRPRGRGRLRLFEFRPLSILAHSDEVALLADAVEEPEGLFLPLQLDSQGLFDDRTHLLFSPLVMPTFSTLTQVNALILELKREKAWPLYQTQVRTRHTSMTER